VGELLELALELSDNSASDMLLRVAGGPPAVNAHLRALGISGIRVDRPEGAISLDYHGVADPPPPEEWTRATFALVLGEVPSAEQDSAAVAFLRDPRDTATPDAVADLLVCVLRGNTLADSSTALLLDMMSRAVTGPHRLKWQLPPGTPVAHKTGTWGTAAVNDVGLITLPGEAGHLAIAVFVKGSNRGETRIEHTIGRIARAAYDHWAPPTATVGLPSAPTAPSPAAKRADTGSVDR
jgi:beta-lactamase class A